MSQFTQRTTRLASRLMIVAVLLSGCGTNSEEDLIESGRREMAQKNLKAAIIHLKSALQIKPDSATARLLLGQALLDNGDPVSAIVELQKARELQVSEEQVVPALARAFLLTGEEAKVLLLYGETRLKVAEAMADLQTSLATAHLVSGNRDRARALIAEAQQTFPGFGPAAVLEARIQASEGDFDSALGLLEQAMASAGAIERAGILRGEILWRGKRDLPGALEAFKQVLATNEKSVSAHASTIAILGEQGKKAEAKSQLADLQKVAPNHPETLFFEAQMLFTDGDFKASREVLDRLLKRMPESPRLLELAGAAEYRLKQYTNAEAFLARALKNAPGLLLARSLLAQSYLRTNQPAKAIEALQPVLDGKNPDGTSLALAGEAWMQLGETKKAELAFAKAERVAPNDTRVRTASALAQLALGNSAAAVSQLETIAAEDKGPRADVALISARLRQNDIPGALRAVEGLERKIPDRPLAYNLRGRILLLNRDMQGAAKAFEIALSKDANYFPAIASLAAMDLSAGKPDLARKRFEDAIKSKPKSPEAWLALAELDTRTGAPPDQVLKHLRDGVKANAGEPAPHLALINKLASSGDLKAALTAAREASAALPNNFEVMAALGRTQLAAEGAEQAITTFKQLTASQTSNPAHHVSLAEAQIVNKDLDGARRSLRKALEIKSDYLPARRALVSLAILEQRPQEGVEIAREMQKQTPTDPSGFTLEGDVELSRKNYDSAATAYRAALRLSKSTDSFVRLDRALRLAGKTSEAERAAAEWSKNHPKDAGFRYYLGDLAMAKNDFPGAEAHYRSVLEIQPRNALAMNNVAWLMAKQGRPGAVEMAEKANESMPGKTPLMDTLAMALSAENKLPRAIEVQKAAIARNPSDPNLKLSLAKLLIKSGDKAYARSELEDLAKLGDKFKAQAEVASLLKSL